MYEIIDYLFKSKPDNQYICVWTLHNKKSYMSKNLNKIKEKVSQNLDHDIYINVGTGLKKKGKYFRFGKKEINGIQALYLDIDFLSNVKKEKNLPTKEQALEILNNFPLKPTIILNSGNGFHVYYFFKQFMIIDNINRKEIQGLNETLSHAIDIEFKKQNFKMDKVHDLSRILRIDGTYNYKEKDNKKKIKIEKKDLNSYYTIEEFNEKLKQYNIKLEEKKIKEKTNIEIRDCEKLTEEQEFVIESLREVNEKFKQSWDNPKEGKSDSEADQSIAYSLIEVEVSEQEIADILYYHAIKFDYKRKEKRKRKDYIENTISKAKDMCFKNNPEKKNHTIKNLKENLLEGIDIIPRTDISEEEIEKQKNNANSILNRHNITLQEILYIQDDNEYAKLITNNTAIIYQPIENLYKQNTFIDPIQKTLKIPININQEEYRAIKNVIIRIAKDAIENKFAIAKNRIRYWLEEYLATIIKQITEENEKFDFDNEEFNKKHPFHYQNITEESWPAKIFYKNSPHWFVSIGNFKSWIKDTHSESLLNKDISKSLTELKCTLIKTRLRHSQARGYILPLHLTERIEKGAIKDAKNRKI